MVSGATALSSLFAVTMPVVSELCSVWESIRPYLIDSFPNRCEPHFDSLHFLIVMDTQNPVVQFRMLVEQLVSFDVLLSNLRCPASNLASSG